MGRKPQKYYKTKEDYYRTDVESIKLIDEPLIDYYKFFTDWPDAPFNDAEYLPQYVKDMFDEFLIAPIKPTSVSNKDIMNLDIASIYDKDIRISRYDGCVGFAEMEARGLELEQIYQQYLNSELAEEWCWGKREEVYEVFRKDTNVFTKLGSPVQIPTWLFGCNNMIEEDFNLNIVEMVALAFVIHFRNLPSGYKECSGHVERWCRCSVETVHKAFQSLYRKRLIDLVPLRYDFVFGLNRNMGWKPNMLYLEVVLRRYGRRFDS